MPLCTMNRLMFACAMGVKKSNKLSLGSVSLEQVIKGPTHTLMVRWGEISTGSVDFYSIYNVSLGFVPRLHEL